jgi:N-acyl amino acid synthase of PEP-CTERM/exosortase system
MVVFLNDRELYFKTLTTADEKDEAYRLRYQVFTEELRWVPCNQKGMEIDDYDSNCVLVGLFANDQLIACLRILLPFQKFMLEKEFKEILGEQEVKKTLKTVEVTRFCVAKDVRKSQIITEYGNFPVIMALEKAFYNWCRCNGIDDVYMVVSKNFFRLLNLLGMPCKAIAPTVKMPDGVVALAAISSWTAFEEHNEKKNPDLLAWFKDCEQFNIVRKEAA